MNWMEKMLLKIFLYLGSFFFNEVQVLTDKDNKIVIGIKFWRKED